HREQPTHALSLLPRSNLVNCLSRDYGNHRPIIISERTTTDLEYRGWRPQSVIMRRLISRYYPRAREVIAISSGVRDSLNRLVGMQDKISIVSNPQDLSHIRELAKAPIEYQSLRLKPRIVNVGRLVAFKDRPTL